MKCQHEQVMEVGGDGGTAGGKEGDSTVANQTTKQKSFQHRLDQYGATKRKVVTLSKPDLFPSQAWTGK